MSKKLNLGCGRDIKTGWVNLDSHKLEGVDVVWNIEKLPLPFPDEAFDEILCQDILEHIDYIPVLRDIHRIMEKRGKLSVRVPHFTSKNNFIDPTHKKMFSVLTFRMFAKDLNRKRDYYFDFSFSKIEKTKIEFELSSRVYFYNKLISAMVNISDRMRNFYESTFLSRLFPAENIIFTLIK